MEFIDNYIADINRKGRISELRRLGLTNTEIHEYVCKKYQLFMTTKTYSEAQLVFLYNYLDGLEEHLSFETNTQLLKRLVEIYHQAKKVNSHKTYLGYSYWDEDFGEASSRIISLVKLEANLEIDRTEMDIHDLAFDVFKEIGTLIEKCINPYLRILYFLRTIIDKDTLTKEEVNQKSLGNIVDKLRQDEKLSTLFYPGNWEVKLNQWGNISRHGDYSVKDNKIECKYGIKRDKILLLNKPELRLLLGTIRERFSILKMANVIFLIDSTPQILEYLSKKKSRKESNYLDVIKLLYNYGYVIENHNISQKKVHFNLREGYQNVNSEKRIDVLLSLLRAIWNRTKPELIHITYISQDESQSYNLKVNTKDNPQVFSENIEASELTISNLRKIVEISSKKLLF